MPAAMTITGAAVDFIETPRPAMTLVPWPVVEAWAMWLHRAVFGGGVVLGDPEDGAGDDQADDGGDEDVQRR